MTFKRAVIILGVVSVLTQPWKMLTNPSIYVNAFLVGSSAFLAPLAGICISSYMLINKRKLNVNSLFHKDSESSFAHLSKYNLPFAYIHFGLALLFLLLSFMLSAAKLSSICALGVTVQILCYGCAIYSAVFGMMLFYYKSGGVNPIAILTLTASVFTAFLGLFVPALIILYNAAWFVGTAVSIVMYYLMMKALDPRFAQVDEEPLDISDLEVVTDKL